MRFCLALLAVLSLSTAFAAPVMSLRLRAPHTTTESQWRETRAALAANPGCCDEVWFSTGIGVHPLKWHREHAGKLVSAADDLRRMGIVPSLQFQATLGHGDEISALEDCSAKDWTGWTGSTGVEDRYCNCPRQPAFLAYVREMSRLYAAFRPGSVWIDDDLRINNHLPATKGSRVGCWCETCLTAFNRETGAQWTRESLANACSDPVVFAKWHAFSVQSLAIVARTIAEEMHRFSPETRMGYQFYYAEENVDSVRAVGRAMQTVTGLSVGLRPGGGTYYESNPKDQVVTSLGAAWFRKRLGDPDWVSQWCPEIDSYPRAYGSRSTQLTLVQSFAALAYGMTSASMLVMDTRYESDETYSRFLLKPLAAAAPVLSGYAKANEGTVPVGFVAEGLSPERLYAWALTGIPVLPGCGKSLGELTAKDLGVGVLTTGSRDVQALRDALDVRAGGAPVVVETPFVGLVLPRITSSRMLKTVALLNTRIDIQGPVTLRLRGLPSSVKRLRWCEMRKAPVELEVCRSGGVGRVTIPEISAWNGGYLEVSQDPTSETACMQTKAVLPTKGQLDHLEDGIMAIVHFGLNTFEDREWGYGDTSPSVFNPTELDTDQWADAMAEAGIRRVVMVAKHHEGFNLWPSPENPDYTVANTPWRDGKGDVVGMIRDSCIRKGMRFGVYLSPWDRHQATYATSEYTDYYHRQFEELFAKYGPISEIWLDGANGGDGWYGGAKERRKLAGKARDYYRIPQLLDRMHEFYPDAIAFGGGGPNSCRFVGNERGIAPEYVEYVTSRGFWETPECDTPLRKGWFWHPKDAPKPLSHLVDIYFLSVGRGCVLNLGIAPNREGKVGADDVARLKELGDYIRKFNAVDLAKDAIVRRLDGSYQIELPTQTTVNAVDVREDLTSGQKVSGWSLEYEKDGVWMSAVDSATIGYRRIERFDSVTARRFRVVVTDAKPGFSLASVALRFAPVVPREEGVEIPRIYFANEGVQVATSYGKDKREYVARWRFPGTVHGFRFDPQHNLGNLPDKWELRLSEDGETWGPVMQSGEFGNILANPVEQFVDFPKPVKIRFAKITALHAVKGEPMFNADHKFAIIFY